MLEFVKSIPDAEVQEVVILRYRERHTWQHIAVRMDYGSEATWRVRCKRYLKKYIPAYLEKQGMM